jgi:TonB-linked SusC/RagA family outer membrane protein
VLALSICALAYGQNITVKGTVTDSASGEGIPFASIQLKGTMTGANTDANGEYSISVPSNGTLVFSSVGYTTQEVAVGGKAVINISLDTDTEFLDDVIVVAFGKSTKEAFTGSATVVKSSDISKVQTSEPTRALEGKVAGVQMTTSSGTLGTTPSIRIRGTSSISAGSSPLYVVDGVPYSGDLNNLNSADIESMTVLKDAASNALYGARGANGVIMITTKKGKAGDAVVNFDAKIGWNTKALKTYDYITDPGEYYETHYKALYNSYKSSGSSSSEAWLKANDVLLNPDPDGGDGGLMYLVYTLPEGQGLIGTNGKLNPNATLGRMMNYNGTDYWLQPDNWMDEAYRQSVRQEYNVSVSGTTGKATILASGGYLKNNGIIDNADMTRYTARLKADYQAKKWLKVGANFGYAKYNYNNSNSSEGSSASTANIFAAATGIAPIYPVYIRDANKNIMIDSRGYKMYDYGDETNAGLTRPSFTDSNALSSVYLNKSYSEGNALNASGYADFTFLRDFKFTLNGGMGLDESRGTEAVNKYYGQFAESGGYIYKSHGRAEYYNFQQLLSWAKSFGANNVDVLLGHENYVSKSYSLSASKSQIYGMDNDELNGAVVDSKSSASSRSTYMNEGYFIRAQYNYAEKIFASASFRRDASSRFSPDYRWGNFWSLGGAWIINKENWFNASWVDMLKLKASIGSQGNDNIGNYLYTDTYSITNDNTNNVAVVFGSKGTPDITWETNTNLNTGIDFDIFHNRLSGSVEYFYRKTADMLYYFTVPASLGYGGYYDNIGDMVNQGVELSLNATLMQTRDFRWDVYANATHYKNKVTYIPEDKKTRTVEGYGGYASGNKFVGEGLPLYTFYLKKYAGVDKTTGESLWYMDVTDENGDVTGRETTNSYSKATQYLCDDPTPKLYGGFGSSIDFHGFDLSVSFTYSLGGLTYDSGYASLMSSPTADNVGGNYHKDILKAWTPENPDSDIPRFQLGDQYTASASDRFLVPASYLNFQNAQIGYTLPSKLTQKFSVSKLRIYVTCDNIYYWSYRHGLDPRYSFNGSTSDSTNSPVRTLSGGINITF